MTTTTDLLRRAAELLDDSWDENNPIEVGEVAASLLALADQMERAEPVAWLNTKHGMAATVEELLRKVESAQAIKNSQSYLAGELAPLYLHPAPEVARDAERWRYARDHADLTLDHRVWVTTGSGHRVHVTTPCRGREADEAVDAAMQEPKP
ncbi:MAG: hypothetical protein KGL35_07550 [Bradyrhizobium sp.]|nr:hypothetical protein [Bradyrhizobium sp.]